MTVIKRTLIFLFVGSLIACANNQKTLDTPNVYFTWMSNTNWLIETEHVTILLDGWITRIQRPSRPNLQKPETLSVPALLPDTEGIKRIIKAWGNENKIDFIISGHSHFDHSFDTAVWAKLTGAHIIGPRSTCLQAYAQDIPSSQCTIIKGGEKIDLGSNLSVRIVRWHHSGDVATPVGLLLQTPMELVDVPVPDPETGGLRPGILEDFPNGGGSWAYLFTLNHPEHRMSWFWSTSGNAATFTESKIADDTFFSEHNISLINLEITPQDKQIEEYLTAAMAEEKLDFIDLWLGYSNSYHVEQVLPIIHPKVFIPQHWGGLWSPFFEGLKTAYANERLTTVLLEKNIKFFPQGQYMDKYRLDQNGITPVPNNAVKEKLGFLN